MSSTTHSSASTPDRLEPRRWVSAGAAGLALVNLGWSAMLWQHLVESRTGAPVNCTLGGSGTCTELWDSAFASTIQDLTLLPVAAWGVLWSVVALALPLCVVGAGSGPRQQALWSGTVVTAFAGALGVVGLLAASLSQGALCVDCAFTYLLVLGYVGLVLMEGFRIRPVALGQGAALAGVGAVLAFAALAYPASQTPAKSSRLAVLDTPPASATPTTQQPSAQPGPPPTIESFVQGLPFEEKQRLSDVLAVYRDAPKIELRPARGLIGNPQAPVRLTDFADFLCPHCADLHELLTRIRTLVGNDAFTVEPRYFPLDGRCNTSMGVPKGEPTRCVAATVMICAAGEPGAADLAGRLYAEQASLTPARIHQIVAEQLPGGDLRACADSDATKAALADDIAWAGEHNIQGTPLVLINGREAPAYPSLIFALVLAQGNDQHPAFAELPAPRPREKRQ